MGDDHKLILEECHDETHRVVVYEYEEDNGLNNVSCFNRADGKLLWRIKPVYPERGGCMPAPYVGANFKDGKLFVVDFYGRRLELDPETGGVLSMDFVK